jgi:hypothetical protein
MHSPGNAVTTGRYVAAALVLCAGVARGGQPEPHGPATSEALALCQEADQVSVAERSAVLARGLDRAEEAVRADPQDAVAHFAVFCNLGKRLEMKRRGGGCSRRSAPRLQERCCSGRDEWSTPNVSNGRHKCRRQARRGTRRSPGGSHVWSTRAPREVGTAVARLHPTTGSSTPTGTSLYSGCHQYLSHYLEDIR